MFDLELVVHSFSLMACFIVLLCFWLLLVAFGFWLVVFAFGAF